MAATVLLLIRLVECVALVLAGAIWLFWAFSALYLLLLSIGAALYRRKPRPSAEVERRICVLIPAHDEGLVIGPVLERLGAITYPADKRQIVLIADNCTDDTAQVARAAGVEVLERFDKNDIGKGYALEWALNQLLNDPRQFDAFLVLDADTIPAPDTLAIMNAELAAGHEAIQARYDVLNTGDTWRTRLMACALALAHYVRPLGRSLFGLSDGLKGNGMCFSRQVLQRVAWSGDSITEDIDYTLRLIRASIRIHFSPDAVVRAQMPTNSKQAASQRQRWEGGRYQLLKQAIRLLGEGLTKRKPILVDRALELIIPPFVELNMGAVVFLLMAITWSRLSANPAAHWLVYGWVGVLGAAISYLVIGLVVSRTPWNVVASLAFAPFYMVWKIGVYIPMALSKSAGGWRRTERHKLSE